MTRSIGFIGLGDMGQYMARNLIKAGNTVNAFDLNSTAMSAISDSGAQKASSPAEAAAQSEVTITMLPSTSHVKEVVTGSKGILEGLKKGSVHIDMSTILPTYTRELAKIVKDAGCAMLDAPVSRGQQAAIDGALSIMVGGEKEVFDQYLEVLEAMGTDIIYCGPSGNGAVVKLVNNLLIGIIVPGTCEALLMGIKGGVDLETILKVIKASSGHTWMLENYFPLKVFKRSFEPGFKLDMMKKDLGLIHDFALDIESPLPLGSTAQQLYEMAHMKGLGDLDYLSIVQLFEDMAKVQVGFSDNKG
jgi:3-hydroxyisobutyrate dehydrogenase